MCKKGCKTMKKGLQSFHEPVERQTRKVMSSFKPPKGGRKIKGLL
jgi:hypothetical protein